MTHEEKLRKYEELVNDIKNCPCIDGKCKTFVSMRTCSVCNEVNLWTYWCGGRNSLDADILVVGQDWGQIIENDSVWNKLANLSEASDEISYHEIFNNEESPTDKRLCELFESIGITDVKHDFYHSGRNSKNIFFTNFVQCYRTENTSGKYYQKWGRNCSDYFKRLVNIVEPKVILCLGRNTFDSVLLTAGEKKTNCNYNKTIQSGYRILNINGTVAFVFPLAHPGTMGTLNRCRCESNKGISSKKGMELQKKDWEKIKDLFEELEYEH